jgi:phenylacetate-CoA ligase
MQPRIVKHLIYFPIQALRGEQVKLFREDLESTEKFTVEGLYNYQEVKIEKLLYYVCDHIPFYKQAFERLCLNPGEIRKMYNLSVIPCLNKECLRKNLKDFINPALKDSWRSTSGTTGSPLIFPKDRVATGYMDAMMYQAYSWHGIDIGDKQARFWGRATKPKQKIIQMTKDFLLNRKRLSAFNMSDEKCLKFYQKLLKVKPTYFYGYVNAIYQFALTLERHRIDGAELRLKVIICTGEVLFAYQRRKMEDCFGCKVVNEYGSTENGIIGFECEYEYMHIVPTVYLEIEEPDKYGFGEILVTELNSRSIPFIRYKIGDKGRLLSTRCPCGRPYSLMEIHEGRIDDYIRCPDGRLVYDAILAYTLKDCVRQFKAYQEGIDQLRIEVIPKENFSPELETRLKVTLQKYLTNRMAIDFVKVLSIPSEPSGKLRYFVSNL